MKPRGFLAAATARLEPILTSSGFQLVDEATYRRERPPLFAMVHLIAEGDKVMPRLSIGLPVVGGGVILSTDLHVLVSPSRFFWYGPGGNAEAALQRLERDLRTLGLPWLDEKMTLNGLIEVFERRVQATKLQPTPRKWWQRIRGKPAQATRRRSPFDLKVLSYCYELDSRDKDALAAWREYVGLLAGGGGDRERERLRALERRCGVV